MQGKASSGIILTLLLGISTLTAISALVTNASAWSNGGYSNDPTNPDYGTHDWIAEHALDWLPTHEKQYILDNLATYLYGTELPDNNQAPDGIGDTTKHHIYYNSAEVMTDDAAAVRASTEYENARNFLIAKEFAQAAKNAGIMSHYIADMAVFGHVMGSGTDWGTEVHHSDYETYVNTRTSSYDAEFNSYLSFDGSLTTISAYDAAKNLAYDTTFDVNGDLTCIWMDQNYNWSNLTFKNRAGESLNLAVNYLTDVLHTLYQVAIPDEIPPITVDNYDGLWHTKDFTITLTATDSQSGVTETFYKINDRPTRTVGADEQPLIINESADNKLEYWSIDNAGNDENHHILTGIKLDKTAPSGTITINNGEAYSSPVSVTLTLTTTDATSGTYQARYGNDGVWDNEPWETPSQSKTWTLPYGEGTKTVYCQIKDNAGLTSTTFSDTIILDTTPPTIATTTPIHGSETRSSTLTVAWTGSDETSGISKYEIRLDGGTWTDLETDTTYTFTGLADGTHTVDVKATDKAGNTKHETISFTVNTSPLLGLGYTELAVITAAIIIVAIGTGAYLLKTRKKSETTI